MQTKLTKSLILAVAFIAAIGVFGSVISGNDQGEDLQGALKVTRTSQPVKVSQSQKQITAEVDNWALYVSQVKTDVKSLLESYSGVKSSLCANYNFSEICGSLQPIDVSQYENLLKGLKVLSLAMDQAEKLILFESKLVSEFREGHPAEKRLNEVYVDLISINADLKQVVEKVEQSQGLYVMELFKPLAELRALNLKNNMVGALRVLEYPYLKNVYSSLSVLHTADLAEILEFNGISDQDILSVFNPETNGFVLNVKLENKELSVDFESFIQGLAQMEESISSSDAALKIYFEIPNYPYPHLKIKEAAKFTLKSLFHHASMLQTFCSAYTGMDCALNSEQFVEIWQIGLADAELSEIDVEVELQKLMELGGETYTAVKKQEVSLKLDALQKQVEDYLAAIPVNVDASIIAMCSDKGEWRANCEALFADLKAVYGAGGIKQVLSYSSALFNSLLGPVVENKGLAQLFSLAAAFSEDLSVKGNEADFNKFLMDAHVIVESDSELKLWVDNYLIKVLVCDVPFSEIYLNEDKSNIYLTSEQSQCVADVEQARDDFWMIVSQGGLESDLYLKALNVPANDGYIDFAEEEVVAAEETVRMFDDFLKVQLMNLNERLFLIEGLSSNRVNYFNPSLTGKNFDYSVIHNQYDDTQDLNGDGILEAIFYNKVVFSRQKMLDALKAYKEGIASYNEKYNSVIRTLELYNDNVFKTHAQLMIVINDLLSLEKEAVKDFLGVGFKLLKPVQEESFYVLDSYTNLLAARFKYYENYEDVSLDIVQIRNLIKSAVDLNNQFSGGILFKANGEWDKFLRDEDNEAAKVEFELNSALADVIELLGKVKEGS